MNTSHVTVDTPALPAPAAGAGGATAHHGKAAAGAIPNGFSAMLDSLIGPLAAKITPQTEVDPATPLSAAWPGTWLPVEQEAEQAEPVDVEGIPPDPNAGAIQIAALPLIDLPTVSAPAGTTQPSTDSRVTPLADEPSTGSIDNEYATALAPAPGVDGVALPAGFPGPAASGAAASGVERSGDGAPASSSAPAPELPVTDLPSRPEPMDPNGRPRAGWQGSPPMPPSSSRAETADGAVPEPTLASSKAPETVVPTPAARLDPSASVEPLATDLQPQVSNRSRHDQAAAPLRTVATQQPIAMPLAEAESQSAGDRSGRDGFAGGSADARDSRPSVTGSSSERVPIGFAVAPPVADLATGATDAASSTPAADTSRSAQASDTSLESQLVQTMRTLWRGGVGEARVTLKPEYLGAVTISLRLEGGGLQAHLHVEDPQVAAWVQANESLLKTGLAGQGLTLERLVVSDDSRSRDERGQPNDRERREPRRQGRGTPDGTGFSLENSTT